jgi:hypothetical protein
VVVANLAAGMLGKYVRVGSIFVPLSGVPNVLQRFVKPLICDNDDVVFPYSIRGTTTALRFGDRCFYFFCRHQILDYDPDAVSVFPRCGKGRVAIGGGTGRFVEPSPTNTGEEYPDVFCMEIQPQSYTLDGLEGEFFPVRPEECWPNKTTGAFIAFGLPFEIQNYLPPRDSPDSRLAIDFKTVYVAGRHVRAIGARFVHELSMIRSKGFRVDGMSGGPVFHIGRDADGRFVGMAGMIMRGGNNSLYFIDMGFLSQFGGSPI